MSWHAPKAVVKCHLGCISRRVSSKKWLSKHGLAAKKLTIVDAMAPTFIPHEPKYVPILDKHVLSKVFDDVSIGTASAAVGF